MIFNGVGRLLGGEKLSGGFGRRSLNKDAKSKALKMTGQRSNLRQRHILRTIFNSNTN